MTTHDTFLRLAAIAVDEPLGAADRTRLGRHVAECRACARAVAGYRADAAAIAALPPASLDERRGAAILDSILQQPSRRVSSTWLMVAAALLALALFGSLWVGAELLRRASDEQISAVVPVPTVTASPGASLLPSAVPSASPAVVVPVLPDTPAGAPLGSTWSDASEPVVVDRPIGRIEAVTAGGPGFVAVGRGCLTQGGDKTCEGIVWLSADGRTWDRAPAQSALDLGFLIPTSGPQIGMFDVAAGGPGIVAVGYTGRTWIEATTWFSPDGVAWRRIVLGRADRDRVSAVTWTGEAFVAVGGDRSAWDGSFKSLAGATASAAVWVSTDGVTWSRVPHTPALDAGGFIDTMEDPGTGGMTDVVAGPGGLAAVGSECADNPRRCVPAAWISPDGTAWERVANLPAVEGGLDAVATRGAGYVAVGSYSGDACGRAGTCPGLAMTSSDGRTWAVQPSAPDGQLASILWIGDRFYATAPYGPVTLWTSLEGAAWSPADVTGGPSTGAGSSPAAWHLAATADAAVWLGSPSDDDDPAAWVSPAR